MCALQVGVVICAHTTCTATALAVGDASAVACLQARGYASEDYARTHPGGALGRRLLTHVRDVMRQGPALPLAPATLSVASALEVMSSHGMRVAASSEAWPGGARTVTRDLHCGHNTRRRQCVRLSGQRVLITHSRDEFN